MTTNPPEQLDPALIRLGRIDKKILLGYMAAKAIANKLEHYFEEQLTQEQRTLVDLAIRGNTELGHTHLNLTPTQVEQMPAEHDELDDMIRALEKMGRPLRSPVPKRPLTVKQSVTSASNLWRVTL